MHNHYNSYVTFLLVRVKIHNVCHGFICDWRNMIDVTKMNDVVFTINADLIEFIEEVPDTIITLTTGRKIMVKETRNEVKNLVKKFKNEVFTGEFLDKE